MINDLKKHPRYSDSGMILIHNGVVRNHSRDGKKTKYLSVTVDHQKIKQIIEKKRKRKGIGEILIDINEGDNLKIGEDLMYLLVMGDTRQNVIPVLEETLNEIKANALIKSETFLQ